jgi:hypothetical protein
VQIGDEFVVGFNRQKLESLLALGSRPGE